MKQNLLKNTEDAALEIYFLLVRFYGYSNLSRIANNLLEDFISIGNKFELSSFSLFQKIQKSLNLTQSL